MKKTFVVTLVIFLLLTTSLSAGQIDSTTITSGYRIVSYEGSVVKAGNRLVADTSYSGKHSLSFFFESSNRYDSSSVTWEKIYNTRFKKEEVFYKWGTAVLPYLYKLGTGLPNDSYCIIWLYFGNESGYKLITGLDVPGYVYKVFYPIFFSPDNVPEEFDRIKIKIELRGEKRVEVFLDCLGWNVAKPYDGMIDDFEDTTVGVEDEVGIPSEFSLSQNYPNPFNPTTSIKYSVSSIQYVNLTIYNVLGQEVAVLVNEEKSPGTYEVMFNASNLSSGTYFYRLTTDSFSETKKMQLLK